jgi:hypothetical protein
MTISSLVEVIREQGNEHVVEQRPHLPVRSCRESVQLSSASLNDGLS